MFRSVFFRSYKDEENKKINGVVEEFCYPDQNIVMGTKNNNYSNIDEDGLPKVGSVYNNNEILVGKTVPIQTPVNSQNPSKSIMSKFTQKDISMPIRNAETGVVDQVMLSTNLEGKKFTKIRMRSIRIPEAGDKLASRHGQKGTIGMLFSQEDMPFTKDGITPDIIVNVHAIPSRMTIAQIIECVGSKAGIMNGEFKDATPFEKFDTDTLCNELHKAGFQKHGYEVLYNGHTGLKMPCQIFIGPTYYQRLKHLVRDKIHQRSYGPLQGLIRQPTEGRSRDGGLRFGEMERDCMISHGAANFLREKLFIDSDKFKVNICELCGITAIANNKTNTYKCKGCDSYKIKQINIPYATKLLFQELMAMNIAPRIKLDSNGIL
jgi:DNA-directed RNA polymerase II subunit RPB2